MKNETSFSYLGQYSADLRQCHQSRFLLKDPGGYFECLLLEFSRFINQLSLRA